MLTDGVGNSKGGGAGDADGSSAEEQGQQVDGETVIHTESGRDTESGRGGH